MSSKPQKPDEEMAYLTPGEAARILNVSPITIRHWANNGLIETRFTAGGHRRFKAIDIERLRKTRLSEGGKNGRINILIVDDDRPLCGFIHDCVLEWVERAPVRYGVTIDVAYNGFQAGIYVERSKPKLVFLDVVLPKISGYDICQDISKMDTPDDINVVAMTGYYTEENSERIKALGACECLAKPLTRENIDGILEQYVVPKDEVIST